MTSVRIDINAGHLGDITVTREYPLSTFDSEALRRDVDSLIAEAVKQARAALGIGDKPA